MGGDPLVRVAARTRSRETNFFFFLDFKLSGRYPKNKDAGAKKFYGNTIVMNPSTERVSLIDYFVRQVPNKTKHVSRIPN